MNGKDYPGTFPKNYTLSITMYKKSSFYYIKNEDYFFATITIFVVQNYITMKIEKSFIKNKPGERFRNAILPSWCSFAAPGPFYFLCKTTPQQQTHPLR